jgi:hypothetical protein
MTSYLKGLGDPPAQFLKGAAPVLEKTWGPAQWEASAEARYHARASGRGGKKLGTYGPHDTRDAAAAEAWAAHPNARQVSTSRGPHGMDIRWHERPMADVGRRLDPPRRSSFPPSGARGSFKP